MTLFVLRISMDVDQEPADLPPKPTNAVIGYWELLGECSRKRSKRAVR